MPGTIEISENIAYLIVIERSVAATAASFASICSGLRPIARYITMIPAVARALPSLLTKPWHAEPRPVSL